MRLAFLNPDRVTVAGRGGAQTSRVGGTRLRFFRPSSDRFIYYFSPRVKLIECSAKDNVNVRDLFKCLLVLSRKLNGPEDQAACPLKRRSSAYVSHTKSSRRAENAAATTSGAASGQGRDEHQLQQQQQQERAKPRSRSLIRRCSRKTKQQIRDTTAGGGAGGGGVDDCNVS